MTTTDERPTRAQVEATGGPLEGYKSTAVFDAQTMPQGFRNRHATKAGVWGMIHVVTGALTYHSYDGAPDVEITSDAPLLVLPEEPHAVTPGPGVQFYVEFLRRA